MGELIDVYFENGEIARTIEKEDPLKSCEYRRGVTCFLVDEYANILCETRSSKCEIDPGKKDLCSGHVRHGEVPILAMTREVAEEVKIPRQRVIQLQQEGKMKRLASCVIMQVGENQFLGDAFVLLIKNADINLTNMQKQEVESLEWLPYQEVITKFRENETRFCYNEAMETKILQPLETLIEREKLISKEKKSKEDSER